MESERCVGSPPGDVGRVCSGLFSTLPLLPRAHSRPGGDGSQGDVQLLVNYIQPTKSGLLSSSLPGELARVVGR